MSRVTESVARSRILLTGLYTTHLGGKSIFYLEDTYIPQGNDKHAIKNKEFLKNSFSL